MASSGDPGWGKAEGRGQKAEGKKEGKFPKLLWYKAQKECYYCCQALLDQNVNVCLSSFKNNLDYAIGYFNDEDEDEENEEE